MPLTKLVTLVKLFKTSEHGYQLYNGNEIKGSLGKLNEVIYVDGLAQCLAFHTTTVFNILSIMHFAIILDEIIAFILFHILFLSNFGYTKERNTLSE